MAPWYPFYFTGVMYGLMTREYCSIIFITMLPFDLYDSSIIFLNYCNVNSFQFMRINFNRTWVSLYTIQWRKMILITKCYKNRRENWLSDSRRICRPALLDIHSILQVLCVDWWWVGVLISFTNCNGLPWYLFYSNVQVLCVDWWWEGVLISFTYCNGLPWYLF